MNLTYKRATLEDIDILTETRCQCILHTVSISTQGLRGLLSFRFPSLFYRQSNKNILL